MGWFVHLHTLLLLLLSSSLLESKSCVKRMRTRNIGAILSHYLSRIFFASCPFYYLHYLYLHFWDQFKKEAKNEVEYKEKRKKWETGRISCKVLYMDTNVCANTSFSLLLPLCSTHLGNRTLIQDCINSGVDPYFLNTFWVYIGLKVLISEN